MDKTKIELAKKTLKLLEIYSWDKIKLTQLKNVVKKQNIKDKNELLININRYFDYLLKKNLSDIDDSSKKDMIFEILMVRLELLNSHRKSIKNLISYFVSNPHKFIKLIPSFAESIILISTLADLDFKGIKSIYKIKILFIVYFLIIYTWNKDESNSLEKTMTTLDSYLSNIEKYIKFD